MTFSKKWFLVAILLLPAAFVAAATADHGDGDRGDGKLLRAGLIGSILSDPPIHGVTRGNVPWEGRGRARLDRKGRFELRIRNLVVAGTDNPDGVTSIRVSLFCAPDSNTTPAFTTNSAPLSSDGDARVRQKVTAPARCTAPVVLVHPNGNLARYIALSGFGS